MTTSAGSCHPVVPLVALLAVLLLLLVTVVMVVVVVAVLGSGGALLDVPRQIHEVLLVSLQSLVPLVFLQLGQRI